MTKPEKLAMHTKSLADEKFAALAKLFPNAVTETMDENGSVVRAIDKDVLAQEINTHVVEGREERYQFTWPDKKKSKLLANAPVIASLRPCREESVDFDNTENLYIEGDNLDVLKLLRDCSRSGTLSRWFQDAGVMSHPPCIPTPWRRCRLRSPPQTPLIELWSLARFIRLGAFW